MNLVQEMKTLALLLRLPSALNPRQRCRDPQLPLRPESAKSMKTTPLLACFKDRCDFFDSMLGVRLVLLFAGCLDFEIRVVQERVLMMLRIGGEVEHEESSGVDDQGEGEVSADGVDAHPAQPGGALGHALDLLEAEMRRMSSQFMGSSRLDEREEQLFLKSCY